MRIEVLCLLALLPLVRQVFDLLPQVVVGSETVSFAAIVVLLESGDTVEVEVHRVTEAFSCRHLLVGEVLVHLRREL